MAFCTKCGGEVPENNQFCGKCGASRVAAERPATPAKKRAPRWLVWGVLGISGFAILLALLPDDSKSKRLRRTLPPFLFQGRRH